MRFVAKKTKTTKSHPHYLMDPKTTEALIESHATFAVPGWSISVKRNGRKFVVLFRVGNQYFPIGLMPFPTAKQAFDYGTMFAYALDQMRPVPR